MRHVIFWSNNWDVQEGLCTWHHSLYFASLCTDWLGTQFQRFVFMNPLPPPLVVFCILFNDQPPYVYRPITNVIVLWQKVLNFFCQLIDTLKTTVDSSVCRYSTFEWNCILRKRQAYYNHPCDSKCFKMKIKVVNIRNFLTPILHKIIFTNPQYETAQVLDVILNVSLIEQHKGLQYSGISQQ